MSGTIGSIGVSVVPDAEGFWRRFKEQTAGQAEEAGREAGRRFREGLASERAEIRIGADTSAARRELAALRAEIAATSNSATSGGSAAGGAFNPLLTGALLLGPALIPIAGAAAAMASAFAGAGAAGIAAFKGIQSEIKAGTELGKSYNAEIGAIKADLAGIEQAAAQATRGSFHQVAAALNASAPALRNEISQLAGVTSSIVAHLVGGLANGLQTFAPLMQHVLEYADRAAAAFEKWSTGPGGAKFAAGLSTAFDQVVPVLSNLVTQLGSVIANIAPFGGVSLQLINTFASALGTLARDIPGLAPLLISVFAAMKVYSLLGPATVALRAFAVAQSEVAVASGSRGLLGSLALGASRLLPWAAVAVGAGLAAQSAANATKNWSDSQNELTARTGATLQGFKDLTHLNFTGFYSDVHGAGQAYGRLKIDQADINSALSPQVLRRKIAESQDAFSQTMAVYAATVRKAQGGLLGSAVGGGGAAAAQQIAGQLASLSAISANTSYYRQEAALMNSIADKYSGSVAKMNAANQNYVLTQISRAGAISQATATYAGLDKSLIANIATEKTWTDAATGRKVVIDGVTYSQKAYLAAVDQAGGDTEVAIAILRGHTQALALDKRALAESQHQQERLNAAVGEAEGRYQLTGAQVDLYSEALGINSALVADGIIKTRDFVHAIGLVRGVLLQANTANAAWLSSLDQYSKSGKTAADTAALLGAALKAGRGYALDYASANLAAADAAESAGATFKQYSASISANGTLLGQLTKTSDGYRILQPQLTKGSLAISSALTQQATSAQAAAEQTYQNEVATKGASVAATDALGVYQGYRAELIRQATQSGLTAGQANALADKYLAMPKDVTTFIKQLGAGTVQKAIGDLTIAINGLSTNLRISLGIDGVGTAIGQIASLNNAIATIPRGIVINGRTVGIATGGYIRGPGTGTSDSINARLSNGEFVVNAAATARNRSLLENINNGVKGFAGGSGFAAGGAVNSAPTGPMRITGRLVVDDQGRGELVGAFIEQLDNALTY